MKYMVGFLTIFSMSVATASVQTYKYDCKIVNEYDVSVQIEVSKSTLKMYDQHDGIGRGNKGAVVFKNDGLKGGTGKMKDRLVFNADYKRSEVTPGEITQYFLTPSLVSGGEKLRNGSMGGFMSFAGQGYSYESFICFGY